MNVLILFLSVTEYKDSKYIRVPVNSDEYKTFGLSKSNLWLASLLCL